jgi:transposase-like protein
MVAWQSRPLDVVYPVMFIDAIQVKIRDGQVANRPVYTVVGVTVEGMREVLGLWVGDGGEGAKYWHQVLGEIRNRGVTDVLILVCDGLRGLVESVADIWPLAIERDLRVASRSQHLPLREQAALVRARARPATRLHGRRPSRRPGSASTISTRGERYPAIIRLWQNAWAEFVPFLAYDAEIRKILYSTNAIESLHARLRRSVRARGHFPTEQAAIKCLYLAVRSLDPTGRG